MIKDKTNTSKIVDFLTKNIPLKQLSHLKRIKSNNGKIEVLIGLVETKKQWLNKEVEEYLLGNDLLPLKTWNVPEVMPKTKQQFESSSKLWPISFHPNT